MASFSELVCTAVRAATHHWPRGPGATRAGPRGPYELARQGPTSWPPSCRRRAGALGRRTGARPAARRADAAVPARPRGARILRAMARKDDSAADAPAKQGRVAQIRRRVHDDPQGRPDGRLGDPGDRPRWSSPSCWRSASSSAIRSTSAILGLMPGLLAGDHRVRQAGREGRLLPGRRAARRGRGGAEHAAQAAGR